MRVLSILLIATLASVSLSSCTLFRSGGDAGHPESAALMEGADEDIAATAEGFVDEPSADETPVDESDEPLQLTTFYSTASLNVRSGRGTTFPVVAGLSYGDEVEAAALEDGWYELFADGRSIGYAHSNYLSAEKPAERALEGMPNASLDTGLFGVSLPAGSSLVVSSPLTEAADASETYRVPMGFEEIRAFYAHELSSLGWKEQPSDAETTLNFSKGDLAISVLLDANGQRFTLTGGQR